MLEKVNRMNQLYDAYETLLTEKQKLYFKLYYQEDLSLSEIAIQFDISRNAVFDHIKRTEKALENYEEKLHLVFNSASREQLMKQMEPYVVDEDLKKLLKELQLLE